MKHNLPIEVLDQINNLRNKVAFLLDVSETMLEDAQYPDFLVCGHKSLSADVLDDFEKLGADRRYPPATQ